MWKHDLFVVVGVHTSATFCCWCWCCRRWLKNLWIQIVEIPLVLLCFIHPYWVYWVELKMLGRQFGQKENPWRMETLFQCHSLCVFFSFFFVCENIRSGKEKKQSHQHQQNNVIFIHDFEPFLHSFTMQILFGCTEVSFQCSFEFHNALVSNIEQKKKVVVVVVVAVVRINVHTFIKFYTFIAVHLVVFLLLLFKPIAKSYWHGRWEFRLYACGQVNFMLFLSSFCVFSILVVKLPIPIILFDWINADEHTIADGTDMLRHKHSHTHIHI